MCTLRKTLILSRFLTRPQLALFKVQSAPARVLPCLTSLRSPSGPSFKRGPPKGYIHSIEQRWHQVECILATIMESPRAQDIINDLRGDPFANGILNRVQAGPYVSPHPVNVR